MNPYRQPVILVASALLIAGFTVTSLVSYLVSLSELRARLIDTVLPLTVDNIYLEVRNNLLKPIYISSLMASDTFVRDWALNGEKDISKITNYLREISEIHNTLTSFFATEKTRNYYTEDGMLQVLSENDPADLWFFRVRGMDKAYEVNLDTDEKSLRLPTIFINHRMLDNDGKLVGVIGVGLAADSVHELMSSFQVHAQRNIYLIDRTGEIKISTNDTDRLNLRKIPGLATHANEILDGSTQQFSYTHKGELIHVNIRFVEDFNWFILVEESEESIKHDIRSALFFNIVVSFLITVVIVIINSQLIRQYQIKMEKLATTDTLTGLYNRYSFDLLMENAVTSAKRHRLPLSLMLFDIDHFKRINDQYGHLTGDQALIHTTHIAKQCIREADILARWGGEEFMILLENCDQKNAESVAHSIRERLAKNPIHINGRGIELTASFGVVQYLNGELISDMLKRVDTAMYEAKETGRNKVVVL